MQLKQIMLKNNFHSTRIDPEVKFYDGSKNKIHNQSD